MSKFKGAKLNLGCGHKVEEGYINVDRMFHSDGVDQAWDLDVFPYPWEDDLFERVLLWNVLEHLEHPIEVIEEIGRILIPGGILRLRTASQDSKTRWIDMQHKRPFHIDSFDMFDPSTEMGENIGFYVKARWQIKKKSRDKANAIVVEMELLK